MNTVSVSPEVNAEVIGWVYRDSQHAMLDRRTLSSCALVCKAWTQPAQRLLFRRIFDEYTSLSPKRRELLLQAVRANPRLGSYIYRVNIVLDTKPKPAAADDFLTLLEGCPNVSALDITFTSTAYDEDSLVERLRALGLRLTYLGVHGGRPSTAKALIDLWPDLQCCNVLEQYQTAASTPASRALLKLPRATVDCYSAGAWSLTGADVSAVRELEVSGAYWMSPHCARTLQSMYPLAHLTSLVLDGPLPPQSVLGRCIRLQSLVFASFPIYTEKILFPRSLTHVGCHSLAEITWHDADVRYIVQLLQGLPALRLVTATRALSKTALKKLAGVCKHIGRVDFGIYNGQRRYRRVTDVDWI
ncbi:hypothetical protein FA95DRAFT_116839 [Auriscalpium vulgare]|uniref:Uncharacterized protein n=1 Tax=Auriscalpium vulgare TaxID=40419 RepID=A0ACB8RNF0_9AGAM|nr:hypothetical protein FA95DRAFT_116839 [Auriscalpium vulgare]